MLLARVEGNVVATRKHDTLHGWRLIICQPLNPQGQSEGTPVVAIDAHGAGMHQRVIISSDGAGPCQTINAASFHLIRPASAGVSTSTNRSARVRSGAAAAPSARPAAFSVTTVVSKGIGGR